MDSNSDQLANIAPEIKSLYEKGVTATERKNYDYALQLFNHALSLQQDFTLARHSLHQACRKKFTEVPPSQITLGFNKIKAQIIALKSTAMDLKGNSLGAIIQCEKALRFDPDNVGVLIQLSASLEKEGMIESAIRTLEETLSINNKNVNALRRLARLYAKTENFDGARDCYRAILEIMPHDIEADGAIKDLDAGETIKRAQWEETETYRAKIRDTDHAKELEARSHIVKTSDDINYLIERNEEKLKENPDDTDLLRSLGELYETKKEYSRALEYYEKTRERDKNNFILMRKSTNVRIKIIDEDISRLKDEKEIARAKKEREELRLDLCSKEVSRYPTNLTLRYDYGVLLIENGRFDEAIAEFQVSVNDMTRKLQSLNMLGVCFQRKGMHDLAITQFRKALEQSSGLDDDTKDIIYNLGTTYEQMGNLVPAIDAFKKIYEVDISYRDIAQKINAAYKKKQEEEKKN